MELFLIALLVVLALAWLLARVRRPGQRSDGSGGDSGYGGDSSSTCDTSDGASCGDGGGGGD